ncbi:hypothetical protein DTO207G8_3368 [Paecilomyces variotii]|nr:hypothetical protein DTO169C6_4502 [Paecilomyces variotii]KAJ9254838.1 hypothetical protein DTO207G8_3368 [Paecilomyces variotii]
MATYQNGSVPPEINRKTSTSEKNEEFTGIESLSHVATYRTQPFNSPQVIPIPTSVASGLGVPTALGIGAFATTLTTLSLSLMEWRGVDTKNVFIANFFFLAAIGMVITAQWELVRGNGYGYVVLSAFGADGRPTGLFYGGYGAIITPAFGVEASFGGDTTQYYNASGFFMIIWTVLNLFFTIESLTINIAYAGIFVFVELGFLFIAAAYFSIADGHEYAGMVLQKLGGACCFVSGMFGWYTMGHLMCQKALFFSFPLGDTSRFFERRRRD